VATENPIIERATGMGTNTMANTTNQLSSPSILDQDATFA